MASLLSALLLLGAAVSPAQAAIAAWWNGIGPQIILQNETTTQIRYSACHIRDQPRYSYTDGSVLALTHKPKAGTPLAGVGWYNEKYTVASVFYVSEGGDIANILLDCNMSTGLFESKGNWIISNDVPKIHPNTGLAAIVLGSEAGYRVYFHDKDGVINEIGYTTDEDWHHRGSISYDINNLPALAVSFSGKENITVASPRDSESIAVTRWNRDQNWYRSTLPRPLKGDPPNSDTSRDSISIDESATANFSLPAWDGLTTSMGISIDSAFTRSLWYIGNDSSLYQVANQNFYWSLRPNNSNAFWPLADKPNADLAVAHDFRSNLVRIYYMVQGKLSELKYEDDSWQAWSAVTTPEPVAQSPAPTPTNSETAAADTGLSTGAKVGVGVGVSLGAIALGLIIAVIVLMRRRKRKELQQAPYEDGSTTLGPGSTPAPSFGSPALRRASGQYDNLGWEQKSPATPTTYPAPAPQQEVHQLDSIEQVTELYCPRPLYELPSQSYSHELVAEPPRSLKDQRQ